MDGRRESSLRRIPIPGSREDKELDGGYSHEAQELSSVNPEPVWTGSPALPPPPPAITLPLPPPSLPPSPPSLSLSPSPPPPAIRLRVNFVQQDHDVVGRHLGAHVRVRHDVAEKDRHLHMKRCRSIVTPSNPTKPTPYLMRAHVCRTSGMRSQKRIETQWPVNASGSAERYADTYPRPRRICNYFLQEALHYPALPLQPLPPS